MKTARISVLMILCAITLAAQDVPGHIPPTHSHPGSVCFGYAMGRAFNLSWDSPDGDCNIRSLHPNQNGGALGSMDTAYFIYIDKSETGFSSIDVGDILAFEQDGSTFGHVAWVSEVPYTHKYDPEEVYVDQVDGFTQGENGVERKHVLLQDVIEGNTPEGINAHGAPYGIFRVKKVWSIGLFNNLANEYSGGSIQVAYDENEITHKASGEFFEQRLWGETLGLFAETDGLLTQGITQVFVNWAGGPVSPPNESHGTIQINWGHTQTPHVTAVFRARLHVVNPLSVQSNEELRVNSNTEILIDQNSELVVYGRLKMIGTPSERILLAPSSGSWKGIRFEGSSANGSELRYVDIVGATNPIKVSGASAVIVDNVSTNGGSYGIEAVDATSLNLQYVNVTGSTYPIKMTSTAGATLDHVTISGNNWSNAAMQFYGSSPTITYAMIDGSGQSYASNGIRFSSSTGSISNSTVRNCGAGNGIVIQSGSAPTISGNTISGNYYYGIVFPTNGYQFAKIMNNTISGNSGGGIVVNGSNSVVKNNIITGSNVGIYLENSSYLTSVDASENWLARKKGGNAIYGNNYGLIGYSSAYYYFGEIVYEDEIDENRWDGSCNDVYGNTLWNIWTSWTQWKAKGNFWGYVSPPTTFTIGDGATVQYLPYNESPGWSCSQLEARVLADGPGKATKPVELAQLTSATKARIAGNYTDGVSSCREVLSGNFTVAEKQLALIEIAAIMRDSRDESLLADFDESRYADAGLKDQVQLMKGNALIGFKRLEDAAHVYESLAESRPKTDAAKMALMSLSSLYAFDSKHESKSRIALSTLQADFGDEVDKGWLAALSIQSSATTGPSMTEVEEETSDLSVFPNPFNPSTEIRFSVKSVGEVRIEVFDLIGRSVDILVNHTMQAGSHSVSWNGDRHPSGMYLLRFTSGNVTVSKKLLLTK